MARSITEVTAAITKDKIEQTLELVANAHQNISDVEDKKIFMILGNMGAGKTCLSAYLMGHNLVSTAFGTEVTIQNVDDVPPGPDSPNRVLGQSDTLYPNSYVYPTISDTLLIDCPGFNDTRENHIIAQSIIMQHLIEKVRAIAGIIFVLDHGSLISGGGEGLLRAYDIICNLFNITNSDTIDVIKKSIVFVITKAALPRDQESFMTMIKSMNPESKFHQKWLSIISLLEWANKQNNIVFMPFRSTFVGNKAIDGDVRAIIGERLKQAEPIDKGYFNFERAMVERQAFDLGVKGKCEQFIKLFNDIDALKKELKLLNEEKALIEERKKIYDNSNDVLGEYLPISEENQDRIHAISERLLEINRTDLIVVGKLVPKKMDDKRDYVRSYEKDGRITQSLQSGFIYFGLAGLLIGAGAFISYPVTVPIALSCLAASVTVGTVRGGWIMLHPDNTIEYSGEPYTEVEYNPEIYKEMPGCNPEKGVWKAIFTSAIIKKFSLDLRYFTFSGASFSEKDHEITFKISSRVKHRDEIKSLMEEYDLIKQSQMLLKRFNNVLGSASKVLGKVQCIESSIVAQPAIKDCKEIQIADHFASLIAKISALKTESTKKIEEFTKDKALYDYIIELAPIFKEVAMQELIATLLLMPLQLVFSIEEDNSLAQLQLSFTDDLGGCADAVPVAASSSHATTPQSRLVDYASSRGARIFASTCVSTSGVEEDSVSTLRQRR